MSGVLVVARTPIGGQYRPADFFYGCQVGGFRQQGDSFAQHFVGALAHQEGSGEMGSEQPLHLFYLYLDAAGADYIVFPTQHFEAAAVGGA